MSYQWSLSPCTTQRNTSINYFVNASFVVALGTFITRDAYLTPFLDVNDFFKEVKSSAGCLFFGTTRKEWHIELQEALTVLGVSLTFPKWGWFLYPTIMHIQ